MMNMEWKIDGRTLCATYNNEFMEDRAATWRIYKGADLASMGHVPFMS